MYLDFYDLEAPPFQLTSDRRFFFAAPQFVSALRELSPDRAKEKGFRVITGEVGTGKSTLCYVMRTELEQSNARVAHLVTSQVGPDDLLRVLAAQFGIFRANESPGALMAEIREFVIRSVGAGRRVVLFIDEAQNLPKPSFKALCSLADLEVDGCSPLEIFLVGQPEFRQDLARRAMKEVRRRVVSARHLIPLGPDETRHFIVHRLRMAGWRDDPSFAEQAFPTIYRLTGGVPRRINVFCNRLLIDAHLKELHEIDNDFVLQVVRDAQAEQLPIGGLSFDEDLLCHEEAMPDVDSVGQAAPPLQHAAAGTWIRRNAARVGDAVLWVGAPMLVGLILYFAADLFGMFEGSGTRVAVVVKLPPVSQFESSQIEQAEAAGTAAAPEALKPYLDRPPDSDRSAAFAARAESPPRAEAPAPDNRPFHAATQRPAARLAQRVPDLLAGQPAVPAKTDAGLKPGSPATTRQAVAPKAQAGNGARTAPLRLDPGTLAPQRSDPPDAENFENALDAALPGPAQPARRDSSTQSNSPTLPDSPTRSSPPARARSLEDFVRDVSPTALVAERVAQAPRLNLIDLVLTRAIVDREPVDDEDTFAVADGQAFAFARIENPGPAAKVFFAWYRGDQVQSNVGLEVKTSARWRTWSAATLKPGSWRVQVLSPDRKVLGERRFVVEP